MKLQDISDIYEKNLKDFFRNEKVIECIYTEQYGEENYKKNKEKYHLAYNEILDNTMFIPYITLDHLREYINSVRIKYGKSYVENNLKEETQLLKNLTFEEQKIIKNYTITMVDELNTILSKTDKIDPKSILQQSSCSSFDENVNLIQEALNEGKKGLFFKLKSQKIKKCIAKYKKIVQEKILIETSSYFKHKSEMPNDKYYTSILDDMSENRQFVSQYIGKNSNKNYRYIYLPVLQYKTKQEYLKTAIHEVMHISKEKISKTKYQSGLFEREISANNSGILTVNDNLFDNLLQTLKWHKLTKSQNLPKENNKYHLYEGHSAIEEVLHHWQVRNVLKKVSDNHLIDLIMMPYKDESFCKRHITYEFPDETTRQFMNIFGNHIQKINTGEMSIREFKSIVGNSNYEMLCKLYTSWITEVPKTITGVSQSNLYSTLDNKIMFNKYQKEYSNVGNSLIEQMKANSSGSRRITILEKVADVSAMDICEIGDLLKTKLERFKDHEATSTNSNKGGLFNNQTTKMKNESPNHTVPIESGERC